MNENANGKGVADAMTAGMDKAAVLAVMDAAKVQLERHLGARCMPELDAARAAVAEVYAQRDALVEAVKEYRAIHGRPAFGPDPVGAALARVQGGAA